MRANFVRLFLAFALAWSGGAAQLHALAHAQQDLAAAAGVDGVGGKAPPSQLKHSAEQCLLVHALDGVAGETGALLADESVSQHVVPLPIERGGAAPAFAFRSRAPPIFS